MSITASGVAPGECHLNGIQTSDREYRNLSEPTFEIEQVDDVAILMRDGANLLADIYKPNADGRFPALLSFSPYPRQIQDVGAIPLGFIEAGASDFFVPRGYVHLIVNARGTRVRTAHGRSSTSRSARIFTTLSNGSPASRGATAMSACSASATSPWPSSPPR